MDKVNERLLELIASLGISKNQFAINIGTSSAMISKITKQKVNFGIDILQKIISTYPHLNQQWLLTGIGKIWNENHTLKPHLSTHLSDDTTLEKERSPAAQKIFNEMMEESKEYREFVERNDVVPYHYQRKVRELLRKNNYELYKISEEIDTILGFKDVVFTLEGNLFKTMQSAFWYFRKGGFNIQEYEYQVIEALRSYEKYSSTLDELVKAILLFYKEMKELKVTDIDFDAYSLNTL